MIKDLKTGSIFSLENRSFASLLFIKILYKKKKKRSKAKTVLVLLINDKGSPEMHFLFLSKDTFKFLSLRDDLCENIDISIKLKCKHNYFNAGSIFLKIFCLLLCFSH